jgi:pimeloyl-ACP methyl ester carboxylesterase
LWEAAAQAEPEVVAPDAKTKVRTPRIAQRALLALANSWSFNRYPPSALIADLRQVRLYMTDEATREAVQERVRSALGPDTRVVVGHSLGSVIAYEALAADAGGPPRALITLGSPLGIPNLIRDRLRPAPPLSDDSQSIQSWVNVADSGDVVALVKQLAPTFGSGVTDKLVHNGPKAHDVRPYLTAVETGEAIRAALAEPERG